MTVVLTVEDEFLVSEFLGHILTSAGYEVIAATAQLPSTKTSYAGNGGGGRAPFRLVVGTISALVG